MRPAVYTADEVSGLARISTWTLYTSIKTNTCPFAFVRIGRRIVFPKAGVDRILGIEDTPA